MRYNHWQGNIERGLKYLWIPRTDELDRYEVDGFLWTRHCLKPRMVAKATVARLDREWAIRYRWCPRVWHAPLQEMARRFELEGDDWWYRAVEHTPSWTALYPPASIGASPFLPLDRFAAAHLWSYDRESDTLACWLRSTERGRLANRELRPGLAALMDARRHAVGCCIEHYLADAGDSLPPDPLALVVAFPGVLADWLDSVRRQEGLRQSLPLRQAVHRQVPVGGAPSR
ncbi:MAG: hypothetical protein HYU66_17795 [Armatimonadetes bacterium]|nr:hypothetical protein [Armatimonadota bacterium]